MLLGQVYAFDEYTAIIENLQDSATTSFCGWKGTANYHHVVVDGVVHEDAAWFYADPKPEAQQIAGRIAFWKDVTVG